MESLECPLVSTRRVFNPPHVVGKALDRRYLIRKAAVKLSNGSALDAHLSVSVRYTAGSKQTRTPGNAFHARVFLSDEINERTENVLLDRYPKDTVLDLVFQTDEIKQGLKDWPYIKTVEVVYEPFLTRYGVHYGFAATVDFAESLDEDIGGKRLYFDASSGLGPAYSDLPDGFQPKDTLGDVRANGSNQWRRKK